MRKEVEALDTYQKLKVEDSILKRIPKAGERFTVTENRFKILTGKNAYKAVFVKEVKKNG